jgi:hypothetical protein
MRKALLSVSRYFTPMGLSSKNKDYAKTKELMIFLAFRLGEKSNYGATLLNKALYFVDNMHYLKTGSPVSSFTYIKQEFGPTPEPALFLSLKDELIASNDMSLVENDFFGRVQKKLIANREPNWSLFTPDEVSKIDEVITEIADLNGSEVSELSHQFPAWQAAADREELPFYTFLLSFKTPSDSDIAWAMNEIKNVQGY